MQIRIIGTGRSLPATRLASTDLDRRLNQPQGWLENATGVAARYVCTTESQVDLAVAACHAALQDAGQPEVDLILSGSAVPYQPIPAMAPLVMRRLGIADGAAAAFDVNSTCLSFLTAFEVAARQIAAGQCRTALVFSAERASRALPWDDQPEVAGLFGDGAAAAVLTAGGTGGLRASLMRTYPSAYDACSIGSGGTRFDLVTEAEEFARNARFRMEGRELFRLAARQLKPFVADLLARAGWALGYVDLVVPHQASPAALAHMIHLIGFDPAKVVSIVADHGNQIAASIPFALDMARRAGRVPDRAKVLLLGTSAGVSFGGMALEVG